MTEAPYIDTGPSAGPPDSVVLDIGGDVGALIVYTPEECVGVELDLTPAGSPRDHHVHTAIRRLRLVDRSVFAGVYPDVPEGRYTVWGADGAIGEVAVTGGAVAELRVQSLAGAAPEDHTPCEKAL